MKESKQIRVINAIERMPKVELHVHLGGSISAATIERLALKNGVDISQMQEDHDASDFHYGHLIGFLDSYRLRCKCLQQKTLPCFASWAIS